MNRAQSKGNLKPHLASAAVYRFLFPSEADTWLAILRIGLGAQVVLFCLSIRTDWSYLLGASGSLISRTLSERLLSFESILIPGLGWLVSLGAQIGVGGRRVLSFVWLSLLVAGVFLLVGFLSRSAAIAAWFLHLAVMKSGDLVSYGVDNFTTIGLFYLMLSPLPDRFSVDARWRKTLSQDRQLLGFWRRVVQTHLCFIYFFGGIAKTTGIGWWNGENVWRSLIRPPFNVIDPDTLVHWKFVFPFLGISVLALETAYPIFVWNRQLRRPWLIAILLMHIGIGVAMGMYLFASVMILFNVAAFGPGILWPETLAANDDRFLASGEVSVA
jgi:hypothetical protein